MEKIDTRRLHRVYYSCRQLKEKLQKGSPYSIHSWRRFPPLSKAVIELAIAAIIARKCDLRTDRHPTIIMAGPTLTWKTSTGLFLCHMLGLDPAKQIVNLAAESGRSLWLRKTSTGKIAYKRELLDSPLVVFDEFQTADTECKKLISIWMDGRKKVAIENQQLTISAVPLITLNPREGNTLKENLGLNNPQIRRSIICNLARTKIPNLAIKGEDIINASKNHSSIKLQKPKYDCEEYKTKIHETLLRTLNTEGQELVDLETLTMLSSAMTSYLKPVEAIQLVLYDSLLLFEALGWTQANWIMHVNSFPNIRINNTVVDMFDRKSISNETWTSALRHLETGGTTIELVTKLGLTIEQAEQISRNFVELRNLDLKTKNEKGRGGEDDQEIQRLEREVRMAELNQKKAEYEKPLEVDKDISVIKQTLDNEGEWRKEHCRHFKNNYCMDWSYSEKPQVSYMEGEPLSKKGEWHISPTSARCAVCSSYYEQERLLNGLMIRLSLLENALQEDPLKKIKTNFQCTSCGSKGFLAVKIQCTKCSTETWWGWFTS